MAKKVVVQVQAVLEILGLYGALRSQPVFTQMPKCHARAVEDVRAEEEQREGGKAAGGREISREISNNQA